MLPGVRAELSVADKLQIFRAEQHKLLNNNLSACRAGHEDTTPEGPSTQRFEVLNTKNPLMLWILEPNASNIGYLDPLGTSFGWDSAAQDMSSPNPARHRNTPNVW